MPHLQFRLDAPWHQISNISGSLLQLRGRLYSFIQWFIRASLQGPQLCYECLSSAALQDSLSLACFLLQNQCHVNSVYDSAEFGTSPLRSILTPLGPWTKALATSESWPWENTLLMLQCSTRSFSRVAAPTWKPQCLDGSSVQWSTQNFKSQDKWLLTHFLTVFVLWNTMTGLYSPHSA